MDTQTSDHTNNAANQLIGGLRGVLRDVVVDVLRDEHNTKAHTLCPPTPLSGKRHAVQRVKIGATLDPVLHSLLEVEARRHGVSVSRILDSAVWSWFGRPSLSFEVE